MDCQWDENDVSASQADGELFGNAEHEQPSCGSEEEVSDSDVSIESTNAEDDECDGGIELTSINNVADFANVEWNKLNEESFLKHDFANRDLAFRFYNWYARVKGFSARKDRIGKRGEVIVRSTFVCYRMGEHKVPSEGYKREPKRIMRCGCKAHCKVRLNLDTHRWHVKELFDEHNHELLDERFQGMLPRHRRMDVSELMQMNDIREAGIGTPSIYQALANQCGGFDRVGFRVRDMYNEIVKQRKSKKNDANEALLYLERLVVGDGAMFVRHEVDADGRLEHVFWCDGISQVDYDVFGDVVAFDATYGKNKYKWPLVVFTGVNHHRQTTIFAFVVVSNETEDTYVWILEQFLEAMAGKHPKAVITDGDRAMKNAIQRVFPNATHRLCAWHLIRNATSNIGKEGFSAQFARCMLGDYETGQFEAKWENLINHFGVQEHRWIREMYQKREMWATAYLRGTFFVGYTTTSRCEGLHSQLKKFVHYRNNLTEFCHHLTRCAKYMRQKEVEADFDSSTGEQLIHTGYLHLERSASLVYTRKVFINFRRIMVLAAKLKVVGCKRSCACEIYLVRKHVCDEREWLVTFHPRTCCLRCSCKRMESYGIPCDHILAVLMFLDMKELPKSLIVDRWTKKAKEHFWKSNGVSPQYMQSLFRAWYLAMLKSCEEMCEVGCLTQFGFYDTMEKIATQKQFLKARNQAAAVNDDNVEDRNMSVVKDPIRVRGKGCSDMLRCDGGVRKRRPRCSSCRREGHNKTTCPLRNSLGNIAGGSQTRPVASVELGSREWNQCESYVDHEGQMSEFSDGCELFSDDDEQEMEQVSETESESFERSRDNMEDDFLD